MNTSQQTSWAPSPVGVVALAFAALVMAVSAVTLVTDAPGRVLLGLAGMGLLVFASTSWWPRPKLAITPDGVQVAGWLSSRVLGRDDIQRIRITEFRRLGRRVRMLEIDTTDDRLRVFTRWDLDADPLTVLDALTAAGYARPGAPGPPGPPSEPPSAR